MNRTSLVVLRMMRCCLRMMRHGPLAAIDCPRVARCCLLATLGCLLATLGCAKIGPPPGGPADSTPPKVLLTEPADGATGIHAPFRMAVHFSEKMDKRTVERNLRIFPPADWVSLEWEENRIVLDSTERDVITLVVETNLNSEDYETAGDGPDEGTITVGVSGFSEDRRGNSIERPYAFTFTAGDSLPVGEVGGRVSGAKADRKAPPITVRALAALQPGSGVDSVPRAGNAEKVSKIDRAAAP